MKRNMMLLASAALLAGGFTFPGQADAAESYDNCNNFIESLPATIATQGVWCLRKDVSTGITSGNAIRITTNNVTIDCNGFKIGGLAGGDSTNATGIYAEGRQNITIRGCGIRGFHTGIEIADGAGHLVEHNRLDYNRSVGIAFGRFNIGFGQWFETDNSMIRHNQIFDTGGNVSSVTGIFANGADIVDNTVSGLFTSGSGSTTGLFVLARHVRVSGNRIRDLEATDTVSAKGIVGVQGGRLENNSLHIDAMGGSHTGILGVDGSEAYCIRNTVSGFSTAMQHCNNSGGNASL